jgi:hypothetical protein
MKKKHDPETFAACNNPRPAEMVRESIDAFSDAVAAARREHRIGNVYLVLEAIVEGEGDDGPTATRAVMHLGDASRSAELAAFAYGYETQREKKRRELAVALGAESAADGDVAQREGGGG